MAKIEQEEKEEHERKKREAEKKKHEIEVAEAMAKKRREEDVDDSKMVSTILHECLDLWPAAVCWTGLGPIEECTQEIPDSCR